MMTFNCQHCGQELEIVNKNMYTFRGPITNWHIFHFCEFAHFILWVQDYVRAEIDHGTMSVEAMEVRRP